MKNLFYITIFSMTLISFSNDVYSDDHSVGPAAVEMLACSFNDGKSANDLNKVVKDWNKWADRKDLNYSAWSMTPFAVSQGMLSFDIYGLDLALTLKLMETQWKTGFRTVSKL